MDIHNYPLLTRCYSVPTDFAPEADSLYIALRGIEPRSSHCAHFARTDDMVTFLEVTREGESEFELTDSNGTEYGFGLRSRAKLREIWDIDSRSNLYLDITGIRHHIWIPLLRAAIESNKCVRVIYAEPDKYRANLTPTEGHIFDLSERTRGIGPIPGFAMLSRTVDDFVFVPLLGFEGPRVAYLLEQVQPLDDTIIPVVGLPGFRPEHPFNTFLGNRVALSESKAWKRVRYASANCPFSLFYLLEQITDEKKRHVKVAMVGTKPHALGAVLFVLRDQNNRELIYDHPVRKSERTDGIGKLLEYDISGFWQ